MASNQRINYTLGFDADIKQAQQQIKNLVQSLENVKNSDIKFFDDKDFIEANKAAQELYTYVKKAYNEKTGKLDLADFSQSLQLNKKTLEYYRKTLNNLGDVGQQAFKDLSMAIVSADTPMLRLSKRLDDFSRTLANTVKWQLSSNITHGFESMLSNAYGYAQDLNRSLNEIRIVTGFNTDQMAEFAKEASRAASTLSTTTTDYSDAALIYFQQGLSEEQVKKRTEITMKMAAVAGVEAETVSDQMTAIWNNFYDGSKSLTYYSDVLTRLGADTASSTDEIVDGLEKFAAVSSTIGLSYEYAAAAQATITDQTRQSADIVGTALRTLFARIQGLQLGETLDDGVTLNKYSSALESVGVKVLDTNGQLRQMDDILNDLGARWDTIGKSEQTALAQTVAGVRQYTQLVALMDNWDNFQQNVARAQGADGSLEEQFKVYEEGWTAASERVRQSLKNVYDSIINEDFFISLDNTITPIINGVAGIVDSFGGLKGILLTVGSIFATTYAKEIPSILSKIKTAFLQLTPAGDKLRKNFQTEAMNQLRQLDSQKDVTNADNLQIEKNSKIAELKYQLAQNSNLLNESEKEQAQILIAQTEQIYDQLIARQRMVDAEEDYLNAARAGIVSTTSILGLPEDESAANKAIQKAEKKVKEWEQRRASYGIKRADPKNGRQIGDRYSDSAKGAQYDEARKNWDNADAKLKKYQKELADAQKNLADLKSGTAIVNFDKLKNNKLAENLYKDLNSKSNEWKSNTEKDVAAVKSEIKEYVDFVKQQDLDYDSIDGFDQNKFDTANADLESDLDAATDQQAVNAALAKYETALGACGLKADNLKQSNEALTKTFRQQLKDIGYTEEEVDKVTKALEEAGINGAKLANIIGTLDKNMGSIQIPMLATSEVLTNLGSEIVGIYNSVQGITNAIKILGDETALTSEKIGAIVGALSNLGTNVFNTFRGLKQMSNQLKASLDGKTSDELSGISSILYSLGANSKNAGNAGAAAAAGLTKLGAAGAIVGLVLGIGVATWDSYQSKLKEVGEQADKTAEEINSANEELKEEQKAIQDEAKVFKQLIDQYNEGLDVKDQLDEQAQKIADSYNIEGAALAKLSGKYEDYLKLLEKTNEARKDDLVNQQNQLKQNKANLEDAITQAFYSIDNFGDGSIEIIASDLMGGKNEEQIVADTFRQMAEEKGLKVDAVDSWIFASNITDDSFKINSNSYEQIINLYEIIKATREELKKNRDFGIQEQETSKYYKQLDKIYNALSLSVEEYYNNLNLLEETQNALGQVKTQNFFEDLNKVDNYDSYKKVIEDIVTAVNKEYSEENIEKRQQRVNSIIQSAANTKVQEFVLIQQAIEEASEVSNVAEEDILKFYEGLETDYDKKLFFQIDFDLVKSKDNLQQALDDLKAQGESELFQLNYNFAKDNPVPKEGASILEINEWLQAKSTIYDKETGELKETSIAEAFFDNDYERINSFLKSKDRDKEWEAIINDWEIMVLEATRRRVSELEKRLFNSDGSNKEDAIYDEAWGKIQSYYNTNFADQNRLKEIFGEEIFEDTNDLSSKERIQRIQAKQAEQQSEIDNFYELFDKILAEDFSEIPLDDVNFTEDDRTNLINYINFLKQDAEDPVAMLKYQLSSDDDPRAQQLIDTLIHYDILPEDFESQLSKILSYFSDNIYQNAIAQLNLTDVKQYEDNLVEYNEKQLLSKLDIGSIQEELNEVDLEIVPNISIRYSDLDEQIDQLQSRLEENSLKLQIDGISDAEKAVIQSDTEQLSNQIQSIYNQIYSEASKAIVQDRNNLFTNYTYLWRSSGVNLADNNGIITGVDSVNKWYEDNIRALQIRQNGTNDTDYKALQEQIDALEKDQSDFNGFVDALRDSYDRQAEANKELLKFQQKAERAEYKGVASFYDQSISNAEKRIEQLIEDSTGIAADEIKEAYDYLFAQMDKKEEELKNDIAHYEKDLAEDLLTFGSNPTNFDVNNYNQDDLIALQAYAQKAVERKEASYSNLSAGEYELRKEAIEAELKPLRTILETTEALLEANQDLNDLADDRLDKEKQIAEDLENSLDALKDTIDAYAAINHELDKNQRLLNDIERKKNKAYGQGYIDAIDEEIKAREEENKLLEEKAEIAKEQQKIERNGFGQAVENINKLLEKEGSTLRLQEVVLDEQGNITNQQELIWTMQRYLNDLQMQALAAVTEEQRAALIAKINEATEIINLFEEMLSRYQEARKVQWESEDTIKDNIDANLAANYEKMTYALEIRVKLNENDMKMIEYSLSKIQDDVYSTVEIGNLLFAGDTSKYNNIIDALGTQQDFYNNLVANRANLSDKDYMDGLQNTYDAILDNLEALQGLDETMRSFYADTLDKAMDQIGKFQDRLSDCTSVLEHYKNLIVLINGEKDFERLGIVLEGQVETLKNELDLATGSYNMLKAEQTAFQAMYDAASPDEKRWLQEGLDAINEQVSEAQENMLSKTEEWAEAMKAVMENKMLAAADRLEDIFTNGMGFDALNDSMDRLNTLEDDYLTKTNQIYEVSKLMRDAQAAADKTTNEAAKTRLNQFMQEINNAKEQNKLSNLELDILKAKYDITVAQIALEEAQNAKTTVRLRRDNEGNFGYVYTGDQTAINQAEQDLADAENALYNIQLEATNEYGQKRIELQQQFADDLIALEERRVNGEFANEQEYQAAKAQLISEYNDLLKSYQDLYNIATTESAQFSAEQQTEAWVTHYENVMASAEKWSLAVGQYTNECEIAYTAWQTTVSTQSEIINGVLSNTSAAVKDVTDKSKELKDKSVEVTTAMGAELSAAQRLTQQYLTMKPTIDNLAESYRKLAEEIQKAMTAQAMQMSSSTPSTSTDIIWPEDISQAMAQEALKTGGTSSEWYQQLMAERQKREDAAGDNFAYTATSDLHKLNQMATSGNNLANAYTNAIANGNTFYHEDDVHAITQPNNVYNIGFETYVEWGTGRWDEELSKALLEAYQKDGIAFASGGYTGSWGPEGRLAILDEKELVLNKSDTKNFLIATDTLRNIANAIDLSAMNNILSAGLPNFNTMFPFGSTALDQNVQIEAHFPNVSNHSEIEEAFNNLINTAAQYANKKI